MKGFFIVVFGLIVFQCGKITDADAPPAHRERVSSSSSCSSSRSNSGSLTEDRDIEDNAYTPVKVEDRSDA